MSWGFELSQNLKYPQIRGKNAQNWQFSYEIKNVHNSINDICKFQRVILIFMAIRAIKKNKTI